MTEANKLKVDGWKVVEEFLLTKGEQLVDANGNLRFKPLIDFAIILFSMKANATNKLSMKFDLEKFFMRLNVAVLHGSDVNYIKVPKSLVEKVKAVNDQYRNNTNADL